MAYDDPKNMYDALERIHDIAVNACARSGTPPEVEKALADIAALARYKFDVLPRPKADKS